MHAHVTFCVFVSRHGSAMFLEVVLEVHSATTGAPADPIKVATFREATRALNEAISSKKLSARDSAVLRFQRRMMKGPAEHNWGLSIDHGSWATDWSNELFEVCCLLA